MGNQTKSIAPNQTIFKRNIIISGTWNLVKATSDWFDCAKNGYTINYTTFNTYKFGNVEDLGYMYNGTLYRAGTAPPVKYTDDTYPLNQLINLKAKHTIITPGIYMVKPIIGHISDLNFVDPTQGLKLRGFDGHTLVINGTLKVIPNNSETYTLLTIYASDNFTLTGNGRMEGDIYEHSFNRFLWQYYYKCQ